MAKRKHIPSLSPLELEAALARLKESELDTDSKAQLEAMLRAASNPNNERIDVVLDTLPYERQRDVLDVAKVINAATKRATKRGRAGLQAMSDAEWDKLVGE